MTLDLEFSHVFGRKALRFHSAACARLSNLTAENRDPKPPMCS